MSYSLRILSSALPLFLPITQFVLFFQIITESSSPHLNSGIPHRENRSTFSSLLLWNITASLVWIEIWGEGKWGPKRDVSKGVPLEQSVMECVGGGIYKLAPCLWCLPARRRASAEDISDPLETQRFYETQTCKLYITESIQHNPFCIFKQNHKNIKTAKPFFIITGWWFIRERAFEMMGIHANRNSLRSAGADRV